MKKELSLILAGDVLISRRLPKILPEGLNTISSIFKQTECCFGNLETTVHRREGYPEAFPGGSYTMADPFCLADLKYLGFNIFNTANNHAMDYSHGGLLATIRHLDELGIPHCGTGKNLADASAPAYYECKNGRIAFIGVTSSFHDSYAAGPQNQDLQGRPGVAPLRHKAIYELDEKNFKNLTKIASLTGINSYHDQARKEGYLPQEENFKFGTFNFRLGTTNCVHTTPLDIDLQRTISSIKDAKLQANLVVVSVHSHQFKGNDKHGVPEFVEIYARQCIDEGANIVVCHGPHVMRGIEIYSKGIIFHGLGDFILQHETMSVIPEEQYWKEGTTRQNIPGVASILNMRSKNGTRGLVADNDAWESYFVKILIEKKQMKVKLYPFIIERKFNNGLPSLTKDNSILNKVIQWSKELYGTSISTDLSENVGLIQIPFER